VLRLIASAYTNPTTLHDVTLQLSTDIIAGFCGETDAEHADTVALMRDVQYDFAFMFKYSQRAKTHAHRKMAGMLCKRSHCDAISYCV
jgi:tRNA A37 methylthiotransferase MiaB